LGEIPEISDGQLPTVTIAVLVRDEDRQLEACLASMVASDYPKLEVLAFDDHSTDRTPEVIKQFAHAGVRFIPGVDLSDDWIAKNQAYEALAKAASGELILFCGADIRFDPRAVRSMVATLVERQKTMMMIVPQNRATTQIPLLQAMRYYWESAPPRRFFRRPPILGSCWMIKATVLKAAGGFAAARRSVTPEAHLARYAAAHDDGYSFVSSNPSLGIWSEKPNDDQRTTAIIRRYPQVHRRPEMVLFFSFGQALFLLSPFLLIAIGAWTRDVWITGMSIGTVLLHMWAFGSIQKEIFTRVRSMYTYVALAPCILLDIWYLHRSMYRYEFGEVHWKGRDVARPAMRR
jgi:glycosyltransferase involved in cell wall biosynthesis